MKRLPWLVGGSLALLLWHVWQGWKPPLTDGCVWQRIDTCTWRAIGKLPYFSENALSVGDELKRIDYLPVCGLTHIPPTETPGRLFLYEIYRQEQVHLVFVESLSPFPLGWATSLVAYKWTLWLTLGSLLLTAIASLFISAPREGRQHFFILAGLLAAFAAQGSLWLFWAGRGQYEGLYAVRTFLIAWLAWTLIRTHRLRYMLLLSPLLTVPLFMEGAFLHLTAEAIIGAFALTLPAYLAVPYAALWGLWVAYRLPILLPLCALIGISSYGDTLGRTFRLLSPTAIGLRFIAAGVGIGLAVWGESPPSQLLLGISGSLLSLLLVEGVRRLIQSRQQRVRLLQESLPQLWERIQKAELLRFAEETLRAYAEVADIAVIRADGVQAGAHPWLRRTGEPQPTLPVLPPFQPDAMLPLPAYGWLLLREGTYRLRLEDIQRLLPFAAGLSIALRHAELFEAAHEARLAALRGQLSPHFLFNALNTLQSLIGEDPTLAEALMSRLGTLLRQSLEYARQVVIPLEKELSLVQNYLAVEQQRFGRRLIVEWAVPVPCPAVDIPPFSVQLLAENVIKHAVSRLTRPVRLQIRVQALSHQILIEVIDDGPGIEMERIHASVGLSNLIKRLAHLYGGEASLHAERLSPGTRVRITLPRRPPKSDAHTHSPEGDPSGHER